MHHREVGRLIDDQLTYSSSAYCPGCGEDYHPAWGSCRCKPPRLEPCVRCKPWREWPVDEDEYGEINIFEVKKEGGEGTEWVCGNCIHDGDVEVGVCDVDPEQQPGGGSK
tara:strand:+ start:544 stop:873 length:330 start_codon:yes stop_codon:yes gene_type:complete